MFWASPTTAAYSTTRQLVHSDSNAIGCRSPATKHSVYFVQPNQIHSYARSQSQLGWLGILGKMTVDAVRSVSEDGLHTVRKLVQSKPCSNSKNKRSGPTAPFALRFGILRQLESRPPRLEQAMLDSQSSQRSGPLVPIRCGAIYRHHLDINTISCL